MSMMAVTKTTDLFAKERPVVCRERSQYTSLEYLLATDVMDKELQALRRARWDKAFLRRDSIGSNASEDPEDIDRKATDIVDKQLGALRRARWEKAFSGDSTRIDGAQTPERNDDDIDDNDDDTNRKATIVIEHLIQASDVSHTMQHWTIFLKWNERLFQEMYQAYRSGHADQDPSANWYKSEIGFFDYYIIPLAKKLDSCGVFGVASDEYLNYALANREEWVLKGEEIVKSMVMQYGGD